MICYKIFRPRKDGTLAPSQVPLKNLHTKGYSLGTWFLAEDAQPTNLAHRPGFHCLESPSAPHMKVDGKSKTWVLVEVSHYRVVERPASQGGRWLIATWLKPIRVLGSDEDISNHQEDRP